jgi:hypothetical protein
MSYLKLAVTAALLACTVGVRADDKKPVDFDDVAFTIIATSCGLHEIELGKVVEKKSTNAEVKAFAAQVVKDHTAINEELKVAAKSARISISQKMDGRRAPEATRRVRGLQGHQLRRRLPEAHGGEAQAVRGAAQAGQQGSEEQRAPRLRDQEPADRGRAHRKGEQVDQVTSNDRGPRVG